MIGDLEGAVNLTANAAQLWQVLAERSPRCEHDYAETLASLADQAGDFGRIEMAIEAGRASIDIQRRLASEHANVNKAGLARALNSLGPRLSTMLDLEEARRCFEEAVELYRALAAGDGSGRWRFELAAAGDNLANILETLGDLHGATQASAKSLILFRTLANENHGQYAPSLALCLVNSCGPLLALDQVDQARVQTQEAVNILRLLTARHPNVYDALLAKALTNAGVLARRLGRLEQDTAAAQEAIRLLRPLAGRNPLAFGAELAAVLSNFGIQQYEAGRLEVARQSVRESLQISRGLASARPDVHGSKLVRCLLLVALLDESPEAIGEVGRHLAGELPFEPIVWLNAAWIYLQGPPEAKDDQHLVDILNRCVREREDRVDAALSQRFVALSSELAAALWQRLREDSNSSPELEASVVPALVSALHSPDLARLLLESQHDDPNWRDVRELRAAVLAADQTYLEVMRKVRAQDGDLDSEATNRDDAIRRATIDTSLAATGDALRRTQLARSRLRDAKEALAKADAQFRSVHEVPSMAELIRLLRDLTPIRDTQPTRSSRRSGLLCFMVLPRPGDSSRGPPFTLVTGGHAQACAVLLLEPLKGDVASPCAPPPPVAALEFPGLLELASRFEAYRSSSLGSGRALQDRDDALSSAAVVDRQETLQDLLVELDRLFWIPLEACAMQLGAPLGEVLDCLHSCSHGALHSLPLRSLFEEFHPHVAPVLVQWPGLPYMRRAGMDESLPVRPWQLCHDASWISPRHEPATALSPLPMAPVEVALQGLLLRAQGRICERLNDLSALPDGASGIAVSSHGASSRLIGSAVELGSAKLGLSEALERGAAPRIALMLQCHAGHMLDDDAHNALGMASVFLLAGSRLVLGSSKAVPDVLMPWLSTLVLWHLGHEATPHEAATRALREFSRMEFPADYSLWLQDALPQALQELMPGSAEHGRMLEAPGTRWQTSLLDLLHQWPWQGPVGVLAEAVQPTDISSRDVRLRALAKGVLQPRSGQHDVVAQALREMAAFVVLYGSG